MKTIENVENFVTLKTFETLKNKKLEMKTLKTFRVLYDYMNLSGQIQFVSRVPHFTMKKNVSVIN